MINIKFFKQIYLLVLIGIFPIFCNAQEKIISGFVTTFDSIPLINVEVKVMSSKQFIHTDSLGRFEVNCLLKDKLKVKAYGFATRKVDITKQTKLAYINLSLKRGIKNQELAVGYGHVSESDKLFSISSLQNGQVNFNDYKDMYHLIRGQIPGVNIVGGDIIIRGANSVNGSSAALIVVDGVVESSSVLSSLSPFDVKSIEALKDGSSAIYGNRGASGVIVITTKKGGE